MLLSADKSQIIQIDLQLRLMPAIAQHSSVLSQALRLGRLAKLMGIPVTATEHCADKIGALEPDIAELSDTVVSKRSFDACHANTFLEALDPKRPQAILAGVETHVCVFQTAIGLMDEGFEIIIMVDAVGSRRAVDRDIAIATLARAGARIATVEQAAFEWLRHGDHPKFGDALSLIKAP
ncbi:MAG: isochorismatase family protein [Alphaproteobacteria bacterium]|nr:isochorismatase family protein [Alphaproteobacteria bacterium SS10]